MKHQVIGRTVAKGLELPRSLERSVISELEDWARSRTFGEMDDLEYFLYIEARDSEGELVSVELDVILGDDYFRACEIDTSPKRSIRSAIRHLRQAYGSDDISVDPEYQSPIGVSENRAS